MRNRWTGTALLAAVVMTVTPTGVAAGEQEGIIAYEEVPGVREFTGRMIARPVRELLGDQRVQAVDRFTPWLIEYVWQTDEFIFSVPRGMTENEVAAGLMATGDYLYVQPDWLLYPTLTPNDPGFGSQWHHTNIQSREAWDLEIGDLSVWVALCDTGCDLDHEDLMGNRISGYNSADKRAEADGGQVADINGHGTNVAGTAAAIGNNGKGVVGVGWDLSHMTIRVTNSGDGSAYLTDLTGGAIWAIENGAKVASVSYEGANGPGLDSTGAYIRSIGGLLVWAAGNEGRQIDSPDHANVIVVGATNSLDDKANYSNYGLFIDVMAPGSSIYTTRWTGGYASVSGTSFSCPMVAGLCALIWSADPSQDPDEVEWILEQGCDSMGNEDLYGYGRINSFNSIDNIDSFQCLVVPEPLFGGETATVWALGGDPFTDTGAYYSIRGLGSTWIPELGVSVELKNAKAVGLIKKTDADGDAWWQKKVPIVSKPRLVWVQCAQSSGRLSNIVLTQVN